MGKKYLDTNWDFRNEDTKSYTHCLHNYPAMMIPQVAGKLIDTFGSKSKLLFDPYCGTGTSLVEASLRDINAIGTDLNPLARLIAEVKTTNFNIQTLDLCLKECNDWIFTYRYGIRKNKSIVIPNFKNIDYWFSKNVQFELSVIKRFIDKIKNASIQDFFKVAFSETVRESSWTRNSEFKLLRMTPEQIQKFKPDVFGIMKFKLYRNRKGMISFFKAKKNKSTAEIYSFNSVENIPTNIISNDSVDIVVTSPPYGDSRTTVAYGQFSRLANQWLSYENASGIDKDLMGGKRVNEIDEFNIEIIDKTIAYIRKKDEKRSREVAAFYFDYGKSINNVSKVIKEGGYACYVVGNRCVKSQTIPNDEITKELFERNNFKHIETIIRNIPNKRMPLENSPSNIKGEKSTTMKYEYIVVCQKS